MRLDRLSVSAASLKRLESRADRSLGLRRVSDLGTDLQALDCDRAYWLLSSLMMAWSASITSSLSTRDLVNRSCRLNSLVGALYLKV